MKDIDVTTLIVHKICALNRVNLPAHETVYRRNRERCAIAIKTAGKTIYTARATQCIADAAHIVFLPKSATYSWVCLEPGECLMIEFEADTEVSTYGVTSIPVTSITEIVTIFTRMEHAWTFKKPAYTVKCMAGVYEILTKLAEFKLSSYATSSTYHIIKPAVHYLETHYHDTDMTNDRLAEIAGISTVYFRKVFTGIYTVSPMKYVQLIRIEKAKDLLISDYSTIGEIAAAVGFSSIYHFSKTFKKITGSTPTEFSRKHIVER